MIIEFKNVSFAWLKPDAPENPAERSYDDLEVVFDKFSVQLPGGMVSVVGPNGVGKSTFLLLAGARLPAITGSVHIAGRNSADFLEAVRNPALEEERNQLVSFVYQNMEFETEESLGEILDQFQATQDEFRRSWSQKAIAALDLESCRALKPQQLAKGQMQRAVIALALCYGSPVVIMDEPVFALEDPVKHKIFAFLRDYAHATGTTIIYSAHDFELCRDYADHSLLLWREKGKLRHSQGLPADVLADERLETAYRAPMTTLFQKERLYRSMLNNPREGTQE